MALAIARHTQLVHNLMSGQPRFPITALRAADDFAPCIDYVLRTLARTGNFDIKIATPENAPHVSPADPARVTLVYLRPSAADAAPVSGPVVRIRRSEFFGSSFLKSPDLPAPHSELLAAAQLGGVAQAATRTERDVAPTATLGLDLIAASFWFLSRYEEATPGATAKLDTHGRFLCSASSAPPSLYDVPVVNRWLEQLAALLYEVAGHPDLAAQRAAPKRGGVQTVALTHDIDLLRKYRGAGGFKRAWGIAATEPAGEATQELKFAAAVMAGMRRDPYDTLEDLLSYKERLGANSTFFLQGGIARGGLDADYKLEDPAIRSLISQAKARGDEFGVHPSYDSGASRETLGAECRAVAAAVGLPVRGSRQHYLRIAMPETLRHLSAEGLRYDSTLGFPDRAGFRCGWSGCFHPFDVERREELPIIEIPLVCMDVTIAVYEKIAAEHSLERLANLLDASETADGAGAFVFLWHNTMGDRHVYPGYWETFEYFFSVASGAVRFITLGALVDEFNARKAGTSDQPTAGI